MSRTRKGAKGPGYEVDRKREGKRGWQSPGQGAKDAAHVAERAAGKAEARFLRDYEWDGHKWQQRAPGAVRGDEGRGEG